MNDTPTLTIEDREISLFQRLAGLSQPCLILYSGLAAGRRFDLDDGASVIGRAADVQVRIEAIGISRRHAEVRVGADRTELRDLGSANHTFLNDCRLDAPAVLRDGDLIRVAHMVLRYHDRRSLDAALHERVYRLATVDVGTDVYNRRYMQEAVRSALLGARRGGTPLAVICIDMDEFKLVNDRYGHPAGDQVLKTSAALLRVALREPDVLGRWGGEEFAVLLKQTDAAHAAQIAERLRATIAAHRFELPLAQPDGAATHAVHRQTISLGVAQLEPSMLDEYDLLSAADRMLYAAKRAGRNCVFVAA